MRFIIQPGTVSVVGVAAPATEAGREHRPDQSLSMTKVEDL
jgi:hypothetical protein